MNNNNSKRRKFNGKGRNNNYRGKHMKEGPAENFEYKGSNDPSWYVVNEAMLNDVASLSFNTATGRNYTRNSYQRGPTVVAEPFTTSVPGIMNINVIPVPGVSRDSSSPVNVASWSTYSEMRKNNSGGRNYDHPDLMMYFLTLDSAYGYYAYLTRIYGLANLYVQQNAYYGKGLLTACGVNADSIVANLANFRSYINNYAIKLSAFATPATIKFYARHTWMFRKVFKDEDDVKAQLYMYQPACFFKYNELEAGGSQLVPFELAPFTSADGFSGVANRDVYQLEAYGNELLAPILASEDFNVMSGDIMKAFGTNLWKVDLLPADYVLIPEYDMEALDQIHNTTFVGHSPVSLGDPSVADLYPARIWVDNTINGRGIVFDPYFRGVPVCSYDPILDFPFGTVEPKRVIVATRGMVTTVSEEVTVGSNTYLVSGIDTCGSDLALYPTVFKTDDYGNFIDTDINFASSSWNYVSGTDAFVTLVSAFNQHPIFSIYDINARKIVYTVGEMSNYIVLARSTLERMHANALMSQFGLPYLT